MRSLPLRSLPLAAALVVALGPGPLGAQKDQKEPRRPKLDAEADTNSAQAYYQLGMEKAQKRPHEAADAFYWASRLAPGWADPLYARWAALHLSMPQRKRVDYWFGERKVVMSDDVQRIDSLLLRAYELNPFVRRPLDRTMIEALVPADQWYFFRQALDEAAQQNPSFAAWFASSDGRFAQALKYYGQALKRSPKSLHLRNERARAYFVMGMHDSAIVDLSEVVERMREQEEKEVVYLYESKAMLEHSIGMIWAFRGDADSAKAAFGRALVEDLSFHPAHTAMSSIALAQGDTAQALAELGLAVQLAPWNGMLHHEYALLMIQQNKPEEALESLKRVVELEPYFAEPHFYLARLHDVYGFTTDAQRNYADFAARAMRTDERRQFAIARSAELASSTVPASPSVQ
jgi:tetratricopeptide (TPR) repeat protein